MPLFVADCRGFGRMPTNCCLTPDGRELRVTEAESGRVVLANEGFTRITGIAVEAARGRTTAELGIWPDLGQRRAFIDRLLAEGRLRDFPMRLKRADGQERSVVVSSALFELEGTRYAVTIARDVTLTSTTSTAR